MTFLESLRLNLGAAAARAEVRVRAAHREMSWIIGETVFPFLMMAAFVLVYRGLGAPRAYEGFVVLGGVMTAYWGGVLWMMASQFFWDKEQGQLQLFLITPISRMSILCGMAVGGIYLTTTRALTILIGGILVFHVDLPWDRMLPAFGLFVLTIAALYSLGMVLASLFLLWGREAWHMAVLFQEPVQFLSGFFFPVGALGFWGAAAVSILPVTLGLDGIRQIFYGPEAHGFVPLRYIPWIQVALLALFVWLAHVSLAVMENLGKREGRLTVRGG
jgi:ABC-2 type transport system permease protein